MPKLADMIGRVKKSKGTHHFSFGLALELDTKEKQKDALLIGTKQHTSKSEAEKALPKFKRYIQGICWSPDGTRVLFWSKGLSETQVKLAGFAAKAETKTTHKFELASEEEAEKASKLPSIEAAEAGEEFRKAMEDAAEQFKGVPEKDSKEAGAVKELLRQAEAMGKIGKFDPAMETLTRATETMDAALAAHQKKSRETVNAEFLAKQEAKKEDAKPAAQPSREERVAGFEAYRGQLGKSKSLLDGLPANNPYRDHLRDRFRKAEALGKVGRHSQAVAQLQMFDRLVAVAIQSGGLKGQNAEAVAEQFQTVFRMTDPDDPRVETAVTALERMVGTAKQGPTAEQRHDTAEEFSKKLKATAAHALELKKTNPERADLLIAELRGAETHAKRGNFEAAWNLLDRTDRQIAEEIAFADWTKRSRDAISAGKLERDRYPLGEGGNGWVYNLLPSQSGAASSNQNLPKLVLKMPKGDAAKPGLKTEADTYEKIGPHPNIARCLGWNESLQGVVMESLAGGNMKDGLGKVGSKLQHKEITQAEYWGLIQFTLQRTLEVMDFLSSRGLVHSDLKPDNIMFDSETGEVKVIDLGSLGSTEGKLTPGTYGLWAPEAMLNFGDDDSPVSLDPSQDMFSLGATAYEAGEGKRFAYGDTKAKGAVQIAQAGLRYQQNNAGKPLAAGKMAQDGEATPIKEAGVYAQGMKTAYVQFLEWALNPDPTKRPTPQEALAHPFMRDRIINDDAARNLIKGVNQPTPQEKQTVPADPRLAYVPEVRKRFAKLNQQCTTAIHQHPGSKDELMKLAANFVELMKTDNLEEGKEAQARALLDDFEEAIGRAMSQGTQSG